MKHFKEEKLTIKGAGGGSSGGKQRTPVEQPNTLRAKVRGRILDLIAYGPIKGLVNGLKSVYLDDTPVENEDGTSNFAGITLTTRNGTPDQDHIPGFRAVENTTEVNAEVKLAAPVIRSLTNNDADAVAVTVQLAGLVEQKENGDAVGYQVPLNIDVRKDGGAWVTAVSYTIRGKTTSPYPKTFRVDLKPYGAGSFDIRVRRMTQESTLSKIQDKLTWTLLTEIIDRRFSYPNMALVGIEIDSELFGSQMPSRSYDMYLSETLVPSNWDPVTRLYSGIWDGSFKTAYHDNPAWAYFDLATHPVIGAGLTGVDKWELYRISQYCDELVPNGYGGMEPRFTINTVFSAQEDAITALNTLANVFRGMTYWGNNSVIPVADMPENPVLTVGPGSVQDGDFAYAGTSMRERHSVAVVMWNDPDDAGKPVPEVYEDPVSIAEFGWRETRVTAVGCNSRGQARRMAMWILDSERHETQTLSYVGTSEHAFLRPGNIIEVADPYVQGARMSGRLLEVSVNQVKLDKAPNEAIAQIGGTWYLSVMLPDLTLSRHRVSSVVGDIVYLLDPLAVQPLVGAIWGMYSAGLQLPYFRVVSNREDSATGMYQITATEYDPNKYSRVELGLNIPERPISLLPSGTLPAPGNLEFKVYTYFAGSSRHQGLLISWEPPQDVRIENFILDVKDPSSASFRTVYTGPGTSYDLRDAEAGNWTIRVRAVAMGGKLSNWTARTVQISQLLLPSPPDSVTVTAATFSITLAPISAYPEALWEFWRSTVALTTGQIESNAQQLPTGPNLVDVKLKPDTQYYYYVRGVNQYGKSTWFPVQGKTLNDFDDILNATLEDVKNGALYQEITSQIDTKATEIAIDEANAIVGAAMADVNSQITTINQNITGVRNDLTTAQGTITDGLANVNTQITGINTTTSGLRTDLTTLQGSVTSQVGNLQGQITDLSGEVAAQVADLQNQIDSAVDALEYSNSNAYVTGNFVRVGRSLYQAKQNVPADVGGANAPPNATYWRDAGAIIVSADGLAARVTTVETSIGTINGTLTSQASTITGIQTTLTGKADASALTALTTRVTAAEGVNTSQATSITNLTSSVAGKADTSALTALTTRVTAAEGTITSQASSITGITAALGNIGGNGSNMVPSEYSWLSSVMPTLALSTAMALVSVADAASPSGYRYRIARGNASNPWMMFCKTNNVAGWNVQLTPGTYIVSFYANTDAAGVTNGLKIRSAIWDGGSKGTTDWTATATRTRYSHLVTITADSIGAPTIFMPAGATGDLLWIDSMMIERQLGSSTVPSAFVAGPTGSEVTGLASAQSALDARVTAAEGVNTSQATSITSLNSSLAGKADAAALTALTTRVTAAEGTITSQGTSITNLNNTVAGKADTTALNALTTRVTAAEGLITTQATSITSLTATLGNVGGNGSNLVPAEYSAFGANKPEIIYGGTICTVAADAGALNGYALKTVTNSTSTGATVYTAAADLYASYNMASKQGKYILSYYARSETDGHVIALFLRARDSADVAVSSSGAAQDALTTAWARYSQVVDLTSASFAGKDKMTVGIQINRSGVSGRVFYIDKIMLEPLVGTNTAPSVYTPGPSSSKVDALSTATTSLDARVTAAEGVNTSQATSITNLNSSLANKADASALTALTTRVTTAEGTITSQGSAITSLTSTVAGKADNSALTALTTRVTTAEGLITSQASSITNLTASLGNIGGNGTNLLPAEYSSFGPTLPAFYKGANATLSTEADSSSYSGSSLKIVSTATGTSFFYLAGAVTDYNLRLVPNAKYIISFTAKADVDKTVRVRVRAPNSVGAAIETTLLDLPITATQARYSFVATMPAAVVDRGVLVFFAPYPISAATVWLTDIMIERQIGSSTTPSEYSPGTSGKADILRAAAISALDTRVTSAEGTLTSQASSITSLNTGLANTDQVNVLLNPSWKAGGYLKTENSASYKMNYANRNDVGVPAGAPAERVLFREVFGTVNGWGGTALNALDGTAFVPTAAGEVINVSCWMYCENPQANAGRIAITPWDAAGASFAAWGNRRLFSYSLSSGWVKLTATAVMPADAAKFSIYVVPDSNVIGFKMWVADLQVTKQSAEGTVLASATTALDTRVTTAEGTITAHTASITSLNTTVAGKADNSALTALSSTVTTQGNTITSQGGSITAINAALLGISGAGNNLLPDIYSWLTSLTLPTIAPGGQTVTGIAVPESASGYGYRTVTASTSTTGWYMLSPSNNGAGWNVSVEAGDYLVSFYARTTNAASLKIRLYDGTIRDSAVIALTTTRTRYSVKIPVAAATKVGITIYPGMLGTTGAEIILDSPMIEKKIGNGEVPSPFMAGPSAMGLTATGEALSALTTRVTSAEGTITSQSAATTAIQSTLLNLAAAGTNLLPDTYSWITSANPPQTTLSASSPTIQYSGMAIAGAVTGYGVKFISGSTSTGLWFGLMPTNNVAGWNIPVEAGNYLVSFYAMSPGAGPASIRANLWDGGSRYSNTVAITSTRTRYSVVVAVAAATKVGLLFYPNMSAISGTEVQIDSVMIEKMANGATGIVPSPFVSGPSAARVAANATALNSLDTRVTAAEGTITSQSASITTLNSQMAGKADASALTALTTRVTTAEGTITSQGSAITALNNVAYGMSTENLVRDPTFYYSAPFANNTGAPASVVLRTDAGVPADAPAARMVKLAVVTNTGNNYTRWLNIESKLDATARMTVVAGEVYYFSVDVYKDGVDARQMGLWAQPYGAAGESISHNWMTPNPLNYTTLDKQWVNVSGTVTVPAGAVTMNISLRLSLGPAVDVYLANPRMVKRSAEQAVSSAAITALDTRVTAAEGLLTTQASSITTLNSTLSNMGGTGTNLIPVEYCTFKSTGLPAMNKRGTTTLVAWPDTRGYNGNLLKATDTQTANGYFCLYGNNADLNLRLKPNTKYIVSCWAVADEVRSIGVRLRYVNAAGTQIEAGFGNLAVTMTWGRVSVVITTPAALVDQAEILFFTQPVAVPSAVYFDCFMLEEQKGTSVVPSSFVPGPATNALSGQADAITSLTTRVTTAEGALTTQAASVTALQSTLQNSGGNGVNQIPDTYSWVTSTTLPAPLPFVSSPAGSTLAGVAVAGSASGFGYRFTAGTANASAWFFTSPSLDAAGYNVVVEPGKYLVSCYASASAAANLITALYDGVSNWSSVSPLTTTRTRYQFVLTVTTTTRGSVLFNAQMTASGTTVTVDSVMIEKMNNGATALIASPFVAGPSAPSVAAQASAISSLTTRVTSAEGVNTSQASSITSLTSRMGTAESSITTTSSTLASTNGTLTSMWSLKLQSDIYGRKFVAGMGINMMTDAYSGIAQSQIIFMADRFALLSSYDHNMTMPFFIEGGTTYIQTAMIKAASITGAYIANAQIVYAHIGTAQIADSHIMNGHITNVKIQDAAVTNAKIGNLSVDTLKIAGRAVTIPASVYTEGTVGCPGAVNVQNWTAVQGLGVSGTGYEAMMTFTCLVSQNTAAGYWRIRRHDGAILASGQMGYANYTFNTPCVSLCISIMTAAAGYWAYYLDIAPWSNSVTYQTIYVANRGITYLEVMR